MRDICYKCLQEWRSELPPCGVEKYSWRRDIAQGKAIIKVVALESKARGSQGNDFLVIGQTMIKKNPFGGSKSQFA